MDKKQIIALAAAVLGAIGAQAAEKGAGGGKGVFIPASDVKWVDVPTMTGVQMAVLQGDPHKGPHHSMVKFSPGFTSPKHHHSANHYVAVLAGTLVLTVDGTEHKLPAGSYFSFASKKQHITHCEEGNECILFIDARGKWDVVPDEHSPSAAPPKKEGEPAAAPPPAEKAEPPAAAPPAEGDK
jgi:quercetin dioxygenase-like cupin family protein